MTTTEPAADTLTQSIRELLDAQAVAEMLSCSARHVRRLADRGAMPRPGLD
jgi:hypothetical protein